MIDKGGEGMLARERKWLVRGGGGKGEGVIDKGGEGMLAREKVKYYLDRLDSPEEVNSHNTFLGD